MLRNVGTAIGSLSMSSMAAQARINVVPVRTLSDNYAYLFFEKGTKVAACVDPAEPQKVIDAAKAHGVDLQACFCTHKHHDHSGGNLALKRLLPDIPIYGSAYEDTPGVTVPLSDGQEFKLGSMNIKALHVPCHTAGHLLFKVQDTVNANDPNILFTGDTLFVGGCGRFFEGDAAMMHKALMTTIAKGCSPSTLIYCGHEYTVSNLKFALSVEPDNKFLQEKYKWALEQIQKNEPTIPSTIEQELAYNPFMRVDKATVQDAMKVDRGDEIGTMHRLRQCKNASS